MTNTLASPRIRAGNRKAKISSAAACRTPTASAYGGGTPVVTGNVHTWMSADWRCQPTCISIADLAIKVNLEVSSLLSRSRRNSGHDRYENSAPRKTRPSAGLKDGETPNPCGAIRLRHAHEQQHSGSRRYSAAR